MSDPYAPHDHFVQAAQPEVRLKSVFAVFGAYVIAFFLSPVLLYMVLPAAIYAEFYEMASPLASILSFGLFGIAAFVFVKALWLYHGRGFWSLIGPYRTAFFDLRKVAVGVGVVLFIVQIVLPFSTWGEVAHVRSIISWLAILPIAMLVVFVQITTEEIVFRGYLQQQLGSLSKSPWVWMILPSAVFGAWHYWNGNSVPEGIVYAFWAFLIGLACADLTARTGTLGAAIGLHFSVNIVATLFVAIEEWPFSGFALILFDYIDPDAISAEIIALGTPWVVFNLIMSALSVLITWLAARIAIQR